jgi:hypothetical protein
MNSGDLSRPDLTWPRIFRIFNAVPSRIERTRTEGQPTKVRKGRIRDNIVEPTHGDPTSRKTAFVPCCSLFLALPQTGLLRRLPAGTALHARSRTQVSREALRDGPPPPGLWPSGFAASPWLDQGRRSRPRPDGHVWRPIDCRQTSGTRPGHGMACRPGPVDRMNPITNPLRALPVRMTVAPNTIRAASVKIS